MLYDDTQRVPERLFGHVVDSARAHVAVVDQSGLIVAVNEAWARFARDNNADPAREAVGVNYFEVCRRARGSATAQRALQGLEAVLSGRSELFEQDYICPGYGRSNWFGMQVTPVVLDDHHFACVVHYDITRRKIVEAEQMEQIEQAERKRLAGQLHDHLQQLLVAASLPLGTKPFQELSEEGRKKLGQVRAYLDEAVKMTRSLSHELRPLALEGQGLAEALHKLGEQHEQLYEIAVACDVSPPDIDIPTPLAAFVYHAVREMLFNAVKHATPTHQSVTVRGGADSINVIVSDDGCGCEPERLIRDIDGRSGTGLTTIRNRLHYFGGDLQVATAPGQGTAISFHVPLHAANVIRDQPAG